MILKPHGDEKLDLALDPRQMGMILGLEPILSDPDAKLALVCPVCISAHNDVSLETNNAPEDVVWKIHCRCRKRSILRASVLTTIPPSAGLLVHTYELLKPIALEVRCPTNRPDCRHSTLTIRPEGLGWLVACGCARRHFRPKQRKPAA